MKRTVVLSVGLALLAPFIATYAAERAERRAQRQLARRSGCELADERRQLLQPALLAARRGSTAATSASSKASGARDCAARAPARSTPGEAQPLVYDGVDLRDHRRRRRVRARRSTAARSSGSTRRTSIPSATSICCGWTSRGVAVGARQGVRRSARRQARRARRATGKPVWDSPGRALAGGLFDHGAPLYYDGLVITGFAGAETAACAAA